MASGPTLPPQAYTREILTAAFNWLQSQPESVRKLATNPDALVGLYMRAQRYGSSSFEADAPVSSQNFMSDLKSLAEGLKQFEDPNEKKMNNPSRQASMPHAQYSANAHNAFGNGTSQQMNPGELAQAPRAQSMRVPQNPQMNTPAGAQAGSQVGHQLAAQMAPHMTAPMTTPTAASMNPQMSAQIAMELANSASHSMPHSPSHAPSMGHAYSAQPNSANFAHPSPAHHTPSPSDYGANVGGNTFGGLNGRSLQMIQEVKNVLNLSSDEEAVNMMIALAYKNLKNLLA